MYGHWVQALVSKTLHKWWTDNALRLSAALSYYTLFSIAPLFTIATGRPDRVDTTWVEEEMGVNLQDFWVWRVPPLLREWCMVHESPRPV